MFEAHVEFGNELEKLDGIDGFDHVALKSGRGRVLFACIVIAAGEGDQVNGLSPFFPPQSPCHLVPIDGGHSNVEHGHVWTDGLRQGNGFRSSEGDRDLMTFDFQQDRQCFGGVTHVVSYENTQDRGPRYTPRCQI